jgi:ATP-dependent DNA ligase
MFLKRSFDRTARSRAWRDGASIYKQACKLGCEGIVSKEFGYPYRPGRVDHWLKIKNLAAPAVKREAEEDWG